MNSPDTIPPSLVVNVADVPETVQMDDAHWGSAFKPLTPALDALGRQDGVRLGMNLSRTPPGHSGCPAGTGTAHQIANPYDEDLVYLGVELNDPHEVCT